MPEAVLEVRNVSKRFTVEKSLLGGRREWVTAVDRVSLEVAPGETLGLVGESGCGKSTLARCVVRLLEPDEGEVKFAGEDLLRLKPNELRKRRPFFQMIFQDPFSSLNPRMSIGATLEEPLKIHRRLSRAERQNAVNDLLESVSLHPNMARRFPHEFSGGQRQRIGIARALALRPTLIVADEPVSALDVSVQAQIINLMQDLQEKHNLTYFFISHDLRVVERLSDRIAIMYFGRIVEEGPKKAVLKSPHHPYTKALLASVPQIGAHRKNTLKEELSGEVPSLRDPPKGCAFHPRCVFAQEKCKIDPPALEEKSPGHKAACFFPL